MQLTIIGTGYVGLVTGVCFAEMGNEVICADIDDEKINRLKEGVSPIYEPGLTELIERNLGEGRLQFTSDLAQAVSSSKILFIAVGTPSDADGSADLSAVLGVADTIATHMSDGCTVVTKSTVPVGTSHQVKATIAKRLKQRQVHFEFDVISNPEFLKEGTAVEDCLKPARVVVGCDSDRARALMHRLYEPFLKNGNPLHVMDLASAELTKYAANAMLATKITFMNELSRVCERVGGDIESIRYAIASDPRIGPHFIYAGLGFGGSCFPKDLRALVNTGEKLDEDLQILKSVLAANDLQRLRFFQKIKRHFGSLNGKRLAIWGLAFKPGTDDVREAPSLSLIARLLDAGAQIVAFDPVAIETTKAALGVRSGLSYAKSSYEALEGADALCVLTEWKPFREPNFAKMRTLMKQPVIFDGRNIYDCEQMHASGFSYYSIGRKDIGGEKAQ